MDIIEKESDRLAAMVAELLDFSRFVSGKITLKKKKVNLADLLEHLRIQLTPRASREEIDLQIAYDRATPFLYTDEDRLKQVFINLLDKRFQITAPGGQDPYRRPRQRQLYFYIHRQTGAGSPQELPHVKKSF